MRIKKISYKDKNKSIQIDWEEPNVHDSTIMDEKSLKSSDLARESFHTALDSIKPHLVEVLELPEGYKRDLAVTGISFSQKGSVTSAVISAKKILQHSNSTFNISCPKKPMGTESEGATGEDCFTDEMIAVLKECIAEAVLYVKGERSQTTLELVTDDEEDEAETA